MESVATQEGEKMKRILSRGAALLTALVLALSAVPWASARSVESEPYAETRSARGWRQVGEYREGLVRVTNGVFWGYADAAGGLAIPLRYDAAEEFSLGSALVTQNGKTGLMNRNGAFLLAPEYDELTDMGYGVYLGRRGDVWDLLSITPVSTAGGRSHLLYAGQTAATLYEGTVRQLALRDADGTVTYIPISTLPQLLESRKAPGWQFPLSPSRRAAFQDVSGADWYDVWVDIAYNTGLMVGAGDGKFEPLRTLTVAETLRLAACLESRARRDDFHLQTVSGPLWYSSSVAYCEASGIIAPGEFGQDDLSRPITRAEMARIFSATTPVRSMEYRNSLAQVQSKIPDVNKGDFAADAIFGLYAKGILNGTDSALTFRPGDSLTRAEAAAIVSRIARPEQRVTL